MTDIPNPGQLYSSSYANMNSMNAPPAAGSSGELPHLTPHLLQMGPMPVYRTAIPQPSLNQPRQIPLGQSGPPMVHPSTIVSNQGTLAQPRFSGQMVPPQGVSANPASMGFKRLLTEMRARQFDSIRFAAYRTASKLRYIQQRTLFGFVDLWRVVETFREFGLHQISDSQATLDYASTARLLARIYSHVNTGAAAGASDSTTGQPAGRPLDVNVINATVDLLLGWLVYALDICSSGRLTVIGLKIALSVLANAKPVDKFRYHFTLLSDPSGALIPAKFEAYLQDLLKLPVSVFEGSNFFYNPQAAQTMLTGRSKNILIEEFLERMLADPGPQLLVWLTIFHRLSAVENVRHTVRCEACKREPICGLRYKCTRCPHYNLCQDCFWTGVTTDQHTNAHDVKEYSSSSKSHSRQFGHSLRKSFHLSRLTGSTTQTIGMSSTDSASFVTSGSQGHSGLKQVSKRPPLGSIFEWNSAPSSVDANGFNKNGSLMSPAAAAAAATAASIDAGAGPMVYRPQMPVTAIRSPLTHRRLQQLNPLYLSAPGHPFPNPSNMMTQAPIYTAGPMVSLSYPSETQMMRMVNPVPNPMVPAVYNPLKGQGPIPGDGGERNPNFPQTPVLDGRHLIHTSAVPPQIFNSPNYMMGNPMYKPTVDNLSNRTPSEPWSTNTSGVQAPSATSQQPIDPRQAIQPNMVNSTTTSVVAVRNADTKCRVEHQLIARYAAQLAAASAFNKEFEKFGDVADSPHTQKQLIAELQEKNRKILKEIERLRVEQQKQAAIIAAARSGAAIRGDGSTELELLQERTLNAGALAQLNRAEGHSGAGTASCGGGGSSTSSGENPKLVTELQALRQRKDELETRMNNLQRNRTELMLQLETLVRLLSVSGGPMQNNQSHHHQLALETIDSTTTTHDPPPCTLAPGTPTASARFNHQSRVGQKPPENPPRRSSSLCHTSTERATHDRFGSRNLEDAKLTEQRQSSNPRSEAGLNSSKSIDKSLIRSELIRKGLLSPTNDPHVGSTAMRFRSNEIPSVLQDKLSSTPTTSTSEALLEKFENLLKKTDSSQAFVRRNLELARLSARQTAASSPNRSKLGSFGGSQSYGNGPTTHYTDSGSEGYLYSDPELGFPGPVHASNRRDLSSRTKPTASRARLDEVAKSRLSAGPYTDNYEFAGTIPDELTKFGHRRTASVIGSESSSASGEVIAAPKQAAKLLEKSQIV